MRGNSHIEVKPIRTFDREYTVTIQEWRRGELLKSYDKVVRSHQKPKVGECVSLLCDPPIHKIVVDVK